MSSGVKASAEIAVTKELLIKYDRPGPRYTSYPTVPEWSKEFGGDNYRDALECAACDVDVPLSVYVHVPFCKQRCWYCGCNTMAIADDRDVISEYLTRIDREISMAAATLNERRSVHQLHWGGGTPTTLSVDQIKRLFGFIESRFELSDNAEIAIETDPRVTTLEQVKTLRELGFNRASMGVQDFDSGVQSAIGRNQTFEQTKQMVDWYRGEGFSGVNIDLVYGLPGQTLDTWSKTLDCVAKLRPDRLAIYSFAYLPARLKNQEKIDASKLPSGPEDKFALFAMARTQLLESGYRAIGMDHFALPDDDLSVAMDERRLNRNFMGYTAMAATEMVGFGTSSIGEIGGSYGQNTKDLASYFAAIDSGNFATNLGCKLSDDDKVRRWLIRQLMCNFYLDMNELNERFGVVYDEYFADSEKALEEYYAEEFLVREGDTLRVLPIGQVFIRNVAMVFDAYLKKAEGFKHFSRTV